MKKLFIFVLCLGFISTAWSQKTIETNPADKQPTTLPISQGGKTNNASYIIPEVYVVAFHSNPLKFAKKNFDIEQLIENNGSKYDEYYVYFRSPKGILIVNYDNDGKIKSTYQRFKNVVLPYKTSLHIYKNYKGWKIVKDKYVASSSNGDIKREFYKIKLRKDKKTETLKIAVDRDNSLLGLALK